MQIESDPEKYTRDFSLGNRDGKRKAKRFWPTDLPVVCPV